VAATFEKANTYVFARRLVLLVVLVMSNKQCPKCGASCKVTEANLELGMAVKCVCGCSFEILPDAPPTYRLHAQEFRTPEPHPKPPPPPEKKKKTVRKSSSSFLLVVVGLGAAYVLWRWNWPKLLFLESVALTVFCWRQKRSWKEHDNKSLSYFLFDKSFEFFVPLTIVLAFYAILAWVVDGTSDQTTLGRLEYLEGRLDAINSYLGWLKFKPWIAALVIVGVMTVDLVLSLFLRSRDITSSWYKQYGLWSKRVSTVVLLLCCFTFFGNAVGERRAHLRTRTDKIKEGYARIQEKAEETLSGSVQQKLYEKVRFAFPSEVRTQFDYPQRPNERIQERIRDLDVSLKYAEKLGVKDETAAELIRRHEATTTPLAEFNKDPIRYSEVESSTPREKVTPPADLTEASVQKSLSEIESTKSFRSRFVSLIKLDGTNQLLCQFPKSFTRAAKTAAFKTVIIKYPFLEPIVDVFVGTFDKTVEQKVRASVDKVATSLLRNPQAVDQVVAEEAQTIASSVEVKGASPSNIEKAKKSIVNIEGEIKEIDIAAQTVKERMNKAATEQGFNSLGDDEGSTRPPSGQPLMKCTCMCGSRVVWGPVTVPSCNALLALCPPIPCR
jgi:hypothetical protein